MLSIDIINQTILELEQKDTTFANCERLAPLYIVRDHLQSYRVAEPNKLDVTGTSNFIKAVNGRNANAVWAVMDELMRTVYAMHPEIYHAVIDKIKDL